MPRTFEAKPAVRNKVPIHVQIGGPSGSGKTYTALELATGFRKVFPGKVALIDADSGRALHYADRFEFDHVPFEPPHSALDYIDVIDQVTQMGYETIIVDGMSPEHEGEGGHMDLHERELAKLTKGVEADRNKYNLQAWNVPSRNRQKLTAKIRNSKPNLILLIRAEEKVKPVKGKVEQVGFVPIGSPKYLFEMTCGILLLPNSNGFPTWESDYPGEAQFLKLPEQFKPLFPKDKPVQITSKIGEAMARWAAGGSVLEEGIPAKQLDTLLKGYYEVKDPIAVGQFEALEIDRQEVWKHCNRKQQESLKAASEQARARVTKK